ncbi:hypothetical protein O0L34_g19460 [Tuta absoluta]|nr:hypothetical protein O0L34_g19460 [Tuta absoluta]
MFRFPWSDTRRLNVWINNCGNATIAHLPPEKLRCRYICIDHFDAKFVRNLTGQRKRIRKTAVPEPFQQQGNLAPMPEPSPEIMAEPQSPASPDLKVLTPKKVYTNKKVIDRREEEDRDCDIEGVGPWSTPRHSEM